MDYINRSGNQLLEIYTNKECDTDLVAKYDYAPQSFIINKLIKTKLNNGSSYSYKFDILLNFKNENNYYRVSNEIIRDIDLDVFDCLSLVYYKLNDLYDMPIVSHNRFVKFIEECNKRTFKIHEEPEIKEEKQSNPKVKNIMDNIKKDIKNKTVESTKNKQKENDYNKNKNSKKQEKPKETKKQQKIPDVYAKDEYKDVMFSIVEMFVMFENKNKLKNKLQSFYKQMVNQNFKVLYKNPNNVKLYNQSASYIARKIANLFDIVDYKKIIDLIDVKFMSKVDTNNKKSKNFAKIRIKNLIEINAELEVTIL